MSFIIGSMRPFCDMVKEFLKRAEPIAQGVATGKWEARRYGFHQDQSGALSLWDQATEKLNAIWPAIPPHRFAEVDKAFGRWENSGINTILYGIDNEIHHRGQGFVYLRAPGIDPPMFWEL